MAKQNKEDKRKQMTRIVCLVIAGVMIVSAVAAAIFSTVF